MKKNYFTLLAFLLLSASPLISQQVFKKSFGSDDNGEYQYDFKKMQGDRYMVTGATYYYGGGNAEAYCIMLDDKGNMLWSKTYGTISPEDFTKCYGTTDKGFLLAFASYGGNTGKDSGAIFLKSDKRGEIQRAKFIKVESAFEFNPACMYEDVRGNYYLLLDWNASNYYGETFTLLKLDKFGNMIWQKSINAISLASFTSIQIAETDNGDIIVCGCSYGDNWYTYGSVIHLYLFSKDSGSVKFCKKISASNCYQCDLYLDNVVVKRDHIYLTGIHYGRGGLPAEVFWFEVDKLNGRINGKKKLYQNAADIQYLINKKIIKQPSIGYSKNLIFNKDGGYMFASGFYEVIVYKYDSLGRICPDYNVPNIDTTIRELVLDISDKSYTVLDNRITIKDYPVSVNNVTGSKTLCSGEMADNTKVEKKENTFIPGTKTGLKPQLYPNPAADAIHIKFEASKSSVISLGIFNATGKQVFTKTSYFTKGAQEVMLDIKSLKPGIYYIKIFDGDKPEMIKFIKQ